MAESTWNSRFLSVTETDAELDTDSEKALNWHSRIRFGVQHGVEVLIRATESSLSESLKTRREWVIDFAHIKTILDDKQNNGNSL